jgi:hypothetical protein
MKNKENSKRPIIQWMAFVVVMLTVAIRIVLFISGIAQGLDYNTLNAITWTGFVIGLILLFVSYLFPKKR